MQRFFKIIFAGILLMAMIGLSQIFVAGPDLANACGWNAGSAGGGDYVPQQRNATGPIAQKSFLTKEQAGDLANDHVKRLNPNLRVGRINDAGSFYEMEILNDANDVVQHLGVDKQTGRLILIK
ncbi:MAG: hypothetical protein P8012_09415 [Desulfobacterales bacterium]